VEPDPQTKKRIAALYEEINAIDAANSVFWRQGERATSAARAQYQFRLDRLEEIRTEIVRLRTVEWRQERQ
jgi:hypothetical protein